MSEPRIDLTQSQLERLMHQVTSPLERRRVIAQMQEQDLEAMGWTPVNFYFLRTFTIEPIKPYLEWYCMLRRYLPVISVSSYAPPLQNVLSINKYSFKENDFIVLAWRLEDVSPKLYHLFLGLGTEIETEIDRITGELGQILPNLRAQSSAPILVHLLDAPPVPALGLADASLPTGQIRTVERINQRLIEVCETYPGVFALDIARILGQVGQSRAYDLRTEYLAQAPFTLNAWDALAKEYARWLYALKGKNRKCLVLDADNTLWSGIVGEDGIEGIQIGGSYPGNAFRDFQYAVKRLGQRGTILAMNSKNNAEDVNQVFRQRQEMVLQADDFAAVRINWQDKATNLRELARELNIGLDSMVYVDDNPIECSWVRSAIPEVMVVELPSDPKDYAQTLADIWEFDTLTCSDEDRQRNQQYRANVERQALRQQATTLEEFLQSLEMKASIKLLDATTLQRAAQLTLRTNQFNLTTSRFTESELSAWARKPNHVVCSVRLTDRYGDNGIVGMAMATCHEDLWVIENLLLSCRVLGRGLETLLLGWMIEKGREYSATKVVGKFIHTPKNAIAAGFYRDHGFRLQEPLGSGEEFWTASLQELETAIPPWFSIQPAQTALREQNRC